MVVENGYFSGVVIWKDTRGLWDAGYVLSLDLGGGYRVGCTLWRCIKLYNYDLCTLLFCMLFFNVYLKEIDFAIKIHCWSHVS